MRAYCYCLAVLCLLSLLSWAIMGTAAHSEMAMADRAEEATAEAPLWEAPAPKPPHDDLKAMKSPPPPLPAKADDTAPSAPPTSDKRDDPFLKAVDKALERVLEPW